MKRNGSTPPGNQHGLRATRRGLLLLSLVASGCGQSNPPADPSESSPAKTETTPRAESAESAPPPIVDEANRQAAREVLEQTVAAYQAATSYVDQGYVRPQRRNASGEELATDEPKTPLSLALVRSGKIRMHSYGVEVVSDGEKTHYRILDLPEQVVVRDSPEELTREHVYLHPQQVLAEYAVSHQPGVGGNLPLKLMLSEDPLQFLLGQQKQFPVALEKPVQIAGRTCDRVQIAWPEGDLILCIDQESRVIRRLIAPAPKSSAWIVAAELEGAEFNVEILDEAFQFQQPEGTVLLHYFVADQRPQPISPLLGELIHDFSLITNDGGKITRDSLAGKTVVAQLWRTDDPRGLASLAELQAARAKFKDVAGVRFLAVNIEEADVPDSFVKRVLSDSKIDAPIVRDLDKSFRAGLETPDFSQLIVWNDEGVVQLHELGFDPKMLQGLPESINQVRAGRSLMNDALRRYEQSVSEYNKAISKALVHAPAPANPAAASSDSVPEQPKSIKLKKLWTCRDLIAPGSMSLRVRSDENGNGAGWVLLVNEGVRSVAEVDLQGKVVAKRELDLPPEAAVSHIRSARAADGKNYFLAAMPGHQRVHLFDENWKRLLSYPRDPRHQGVLDARLADVNGDGSLEMILGYRGVAGAHCVSLKGERLWANRSLEDVWNIALLAPDAKGRRVSLCVNGQGTLVRVDSNGVSGSELLVGRSVGQPLGRFLKYVAAEDLNGDGRPELLGVAVTEVRGDVVVGFDLQGREQWKYPLPERLHDPPQPIVFGRIAGVPQGVWLIAGRGGSLHLLSAEGKPLDRFEYGAHIGGMALAQIGSRTLLIVSGGRKTDDGENLR
ncbi:MAG: hypothetical protein N2C14_01410, partial [Planctomycetales bacterium]